MSEQTEKVLHDLCVRQAKILTQVVNVLRGPPPDLRHWPHHDLADRAIDAVAENKRLREALGEMRDVAAAMARVIAENGCVEELERELQAAGIPDRFGARAEAFLRGEEAR